MGWPWPPPVRVRRRDGAGDVPACLERRVRRVPRTEAGTGHYGEFLPFLMAVSTGPTAAPTLCRHRRHSPAQEEA